MRLIAAREDQHGTESYGLHSYVGGTMFESLSGPEEDGGGKGQGGGGESANGTLFLASQPRWSRASQRALTRHRGPSGGGGDGG